jgi:hypothetical protein
MSVWSARSCFPGREVAYTRDAVLLEETDRVAGEAARSASSRPGSVVYVRSSTTRLAGSARASPESQPTLPKSSPRAKIASAIAKLSGNRVITVNPPSRSNRISASFCPLSRINKRGCEPTLRLPVERPVLANTHALHFFADGGSTAAPAKRFAFSHRENGKISLVKEKSS